MKDRPKITAKFCSSFVSAVHRLATSYVRLGSAKLLSSFFCSNSKVNPFPTYRQDGFKG